jgi:hypothetical protein
MGVYRDERLAHERPSGGWRWRPQDVELKAIVNPSEESLEALLVVRQQEADAGLSYETSTRTPVITSWFLGRMIYAPASRVLKAWHEENDSDDGSWTFDELDGTGVSIATVPNRRPEAPSSPKSGDSASS